MNDRTPDPTGSSAEAGEAGAPPLEKPSMGPLARFLNVLFSPGKVFEDIRKNPRGWWAPIVIGATVTAIFATAYVGKYDMGLVLREQLKDHWSMKMVAGLQGPEARDKALDATVKQVEATPVWQMQLSQWAQVFFGWTLVVWFFTFLYSLMAILMGWLPQARASKLWINFGIVLGITVLLTVASGALQFAQRAGGGAAGPSAPPAWIAVTGTGLALVAISAIFWAISRLARELAFGRILGATSYGMAPLAIGSLLGIVIVLVKAPDATPFEELVPSNLTALLKLDEGSPVLASLGSSIGLFSIWSLVLTIIGISKVLGRSMGEAAAVVLVPWAVWVLLKAVFAAAIG